MALKFLNDGYFDGKVGIGTNTPDATLEPVNISATSDGDGSASDTLSGQDSILLSTKAGTFEETSGSITWRNGARRRAMITGVNESVSGDGDILGLAFYTQGTDGAGDFFESMRIAHSGNVGIGTTSPLDLLALHNNATGAVDAQMNFTTAATGQAVGDGFRVGWNGTVAQMYLFENADMRIGTNNEERIRILADGNVGIGTTNPLAKLHVKETTSDVAGEIIVGGLIDTDTDDVAFGKLNFANINSANTQTNDILASISGEKPDSSNRGELVFSTSNETAPVERMRIDKDGNVGIGTTNPEKILHLDADQGRAIIQLDKGGDRIVSLGTASSETGADNTILRLLNEGVEKVRIFTEGNSWLNGGNVGIGTTTPGAKLGITGSTPTAGDTTLHLKLPVGNVTAGTTEMGNILFSSADASNGGSGSIAKISTIAGNGSNAWIGQGRPTDLAFFTQPIGDTATLVEAMRINQNGNVGIGATTPITLLNLEGVKNTSIITLESTTNDSNWSVGDKFGAINFYSADASGAGAGVKASMSYEVSNGATGATNALVFNTAGTTTGTNNTERMRIDSVGNVGIGTDDPTEKLEVAGNSITRSKTRGLGTNYATSEGWKAGAASTFTFREGFFGGNFVNNGPSGENKVEFDNGPFGSRECVWMTVPEVGNDNDGGWNKTMDGFDNSTNNGFMSVVYVRRDSGTASGSFFHGCSGTATNNLDGTANTNPYFSIGMATSNFPADVWCVAIGIIYASSDASTTPSTLGGIYRLDTGVKFSNLTTFRQKSGATTQQQRVYHFYSTSTTSQLDFARPGFYVLDGSEPTLSELTAGAAGGDDAFWSANGNDIYNDNTGNVGIGTTSPDYKLDITETTAETNTLKDVLRLNHITSGTAASGLGAGILFSAERPLNGVNLSRGAIYGVSGPNENDDGDLAFHTRTDTAPDSATAGMNEKMRITHDGKVGIGTTTPVELLYVENPSGDARIGINAPAGSDTEIKFSNADVVQYTIGHDDSTDNFVIGGANVDDPFISIDKSGNVGIGETEPSALLHVRAATNVTGTIEVQGGKATVTAVGEVNSELNFGSNDGSIVGGIGGSIKSITEASNGAYVGMSFYTAKQGRTPVLEEAMRINHDGKVGIGNDNPSEKLTVEDSVNNIQMRVGSLTAGISPIIRLQGKNTANTVPYYTDIELNAETGVLLLNDPGTSGSSIGQNPVSIDSTGKLGVGTVSATAPLQVVGIAEYTNNTTALAAGLTAGAFYRTGDLLKVVH